VFRLPHQADSRRLELSHGNVVNFNSIDGTISLIQNMSDHVLIAIDAKSLDLRGPVNDFKNMCLVKDFYNPELNAISIIHVRKWVIKA